MADDRVVLIKSDKVSKIAVEKSSSAQSASDDLICQSSTMPGKVKGQLNTGSSVGAGGRMQEHKSREAKSLESGIGWKIDRGVDQMRYAANRCWLEKPNEMLSVVLGL